MTTGGRGNGGGVVVPHQPQRAESQATSIEQSRAVAQVYAAVLAAKQCPREVARGLEYMRMSCRMTEVAEQAFYRFPRGGKTVSGPSVHLARELARCWGNMEFGVSELSREPGRSEMLAFAIDLELNVRSSATFIVQHKRDKRDADGGLVDLTDMRDIYENNANQGARRVREAIFAVLPPWFVEQAKSLCQETLVKGTDDKPLPPLPVRVASCIEMFGKLGVSEARLAAKIGSSSGQWTDFDVAELGKVYRSILRGEIAKETEFPVNVVTSEAIRAGVSERTVKPSSSVAAQPEQAGPGDRWDEVLEYEQGQGDQS